MSILSDRVKACVIGDMDLVRPLALAGIKSVVIAPPGNPVFFSRFVLKDLSWEDPWDDTDAYAEQRIAALMRFGATQAEPPVLYYQGDVDLLLVSRYRNQLAQYFRFVLAESELVEDLVNKARFQERAERLNLPVPATRLIHPSSDPSKQIDLRFPVVIKPLGRRNDWKSIGGSYKALLVETTDRLRELWPALGASGIDVLVQEAIPGPESCIESYHVYVDQLGITVAEFAGRKIRTQPATCGHSTALETIDARDVIALGRGIVSKLDLRGVAKLDFKRGPEGTLHLLEINPRFSLWHHLGAVAGVNIPALVYGDLVGLPRPLGSSVRAGIRWCAPFPDFSAARACGMPVRTWLLWALQCEAKSGVAWDDPMPILREIIKKMHHLWAR